MSFFVGLVLCFFHKCHKRRVAKTDFILFFLSQSLQLNLPKVSRIIDHKNANITITSFFLWYYYYTTKREGSQYANCTNFSSFFCLFCTMRPGATPRLVSESFALRYKVSCLILVKYLFCLNTVCLCFAVNIKQSVLANIFKIVMGNFCVNKCLV